MSFDINSDPLVTKVTNDPIPFKHNIIQKFSEHDLPKDFIVEEEWHDNADVPVNQIVGTQHPDYIGLTWEELLYKGKRMHINLPLAQENPGYYYSDEKKLPTMSFNKHEGLYYVAGDGNHRSVIAKFLFYFSGHRMLTNVSVYEYKVNWEGHSRFEELSNAITKSGLRISAKTHRTATGREDSSGYKLDRFKTATIITNHDSGEAFVIDDLSDPESIHKLKQLTEAIHNRSFFSRWFSSNPYAKFVG